VRIFTYYIFAFALLFILPAYSQSFEWTWVSGDNVAQQPAVYGTKGVPSVNNKPGSRNGAVSWRDANGNLWLFGGSGFTTSASSASGQLNDLKYVLKKYLNMRPKLLY
jgi:hypothetical protein